jgi:hypothetical protein
LGILIFGIATSLGSGWNAAVPNATQATEIWHHEVTTVDGSLLRETLLEVASRESRGMPSLTVYTDAASDSVTAWQLRDFTDVHFIEDETDAQGQPVIILSTVPLGSAPPDLGGDYVGQDFILRRSWQGLPAIEFLQWWLQRRTGHQTIPVEMVVLWLREDVYHGVDMLETTDNDNAG